MHSSSSGRYYNGHFGWIERDRLQFVLQGRRLGLTAGCHWFFIVFAHQLAYKPGWWKCRTSCCTRRTSRQFFGCTRSKELYRRVESPFEVGKNKAQKSFIRFNCNIALICSFLVQPLPIYSQKLKVLPLRTHWWRKISRLLATVCWHCRRKI